MTPEDFDRTVLAYDVWGGDESPYRVLRHLMVIVRESHECAICFQPIVRGERVRAQAEVCEGVCKTFRFCAACCRAMAKNRRDDGRAMERRYQLGAVTALAAQAETRVETIVVIKHRETGPSA
jgi:hypothetical protein